MIFNSGNIHLSQNRFLRMQWYQAVGLAEFISADHIVRIFVGFVFGDFMIVR